MNRNSEGSTSSGKIRLRKHSKERNSKKHKRKIKNDSSTARVTQGSQKGDENGIQLLEKKHGDGKRRDHGSRNQMQASRRSNGILRK